MNVGRRIALPGAPGALRVFTRGRFHAPPNVHERHDRSWLAAILVVAAAMRLPGLWRFPFEQDELYTVQEARDLFRVALEPGIEARPLYFLLQHLLLDLLPQSPLGLRAVPFLFGVLGIWATWRLAVQALGTTAGAAAGILVAISPWHLHASGMARYWSLLYLLAAVFYLSLLRAYEHDQPRLYRTALVALVLGTATHPTLLFPAAGAALGVSLVRADGEFGWRWPSRRAWQWLWGPFALFLLAAYLALKLTRNESAIQNWSGRGWLASLRLIPAMVEWLTPAVAVAGFVGALFLLRQSTSHRRRLGAMTLGASVTAVLLLLFASTRTDVYADYAIAMLPLLFVAAGALAGLTWEALPAGSRPLGWAGVVVLAAAVVPSTASHLSDGTRFDYRPAYRRIQAAAPELSVLTWPLVVQRHYAPGLRGREVPLQPERLEALLRQEHELWVVASIRRYGMVGDDLGRVRAWLGTRCSLDGAHQRPRWDYRIYRVELYRCRGPESTSSAGEP